MERPEMGQWCMTNNEAEKTRRDMPTSDHNKDGHQHVEWRHRFVGWKPTPVKAMYIGYRMKRDGEFWTSGGREDYEQCFKIKKSIEVWLFVKNNRSKPFPVFPEDVEYIKGLQS